MIKLEKVTYKNTLECVNISLDNKSIIYGNKKEGIELIMDILYGKSTISSGSIKLVNDFFEYEKSIRKCFIPHNICSMFNNLKVKHLLNFYSFNPKNTEIIQEYKISLNTKIKKLNTFQKIALFTQIKLCKKNDLFLFNEPTLLMDTEEIAKFESLVLNQLKNKIVLISTRKKNDLSDLQGFSKYHLNNMNLYRRS